MAKLETVKRATTYTLELTEEEAAYLELVLRECSVRRPEGDSVWNALDQAGVDGGELFTVSGSIKVEKNG